jgi:hypothetical protein
MSLFGNPNRAGYNDFALTPRFAGVFACQRSKIWETMIELSLLTASVVGIELTELNSSSPCLLFNSKFWLLDS